MFLQLETVVYSDFVLERMERMIRPLTMVIVLLLGICLFVDAHGDHDHGDHHHGHGHGDHHHRGPDHEDDDEEPKAKTTDLPKIDPEELEYHKGSLCGYCEYCKVAFLFRASVGSSE